MSFMEELDHSESQLVIALPDEEVEFTGKSK
jgi:hypothetical protein